MRTQHIPLFIHKEDRVNEKDGKESVLGEVLFIQSNQLNQMLTADQTDQKQAQTPAQGGNGSKCQSTLGAVPISCS